MIKESNLKRVIKGAVAGAVAGIVASWAANQFHSLWSHLAGEGENTEVARLSDRGGRPDTAAAKEKVASGGPLQEDATIAIASKVSKAVPDRPLTKKEKHQAGVGIHYAFGTASGALYGAVSELAPLTKIDRRSDHDSDCRPGCDTSACKLHARPHRFRRIETEPSGTPSVS